MPEDETPRYELKITATGVVRDAEGNVLSSEPYETRMELTEQQMLEHLAEQQKES